MVWPSAFEGGGFLSSYARLFSMSIIPAAPAGVRLQAFDLTGASHQRKLPWQLVLTNRRLEKSLPQGDSGPDGVLLRSWFVHINRFVCVCVCVCVCARAHFFLSLETPKRRFGADRVLHCACDSRTDSRAETVALNSCDQKDVYGVAHMLLLVQDGND